ncbi:papain cysteine protease family protein [Ceratobasidium sp. AG-Ba]|nr:papain cysteine protease family protein [Ceratobasidium sp. AG-Ba]QRW10111.1 papain cysteine protease family protein [Ceratobasidium sp. AG-Ba]
MLTPQRLPYILSLLIQSENPLPMSFFNILAGAAEENFNLGAEAIDVAHRTHNGLFDALGVNNILPTPVKNLTDGIYDTNRAIVSATGKKTAGVLRTIGGALSGDQGSPHDDSEEEDKTNAGYNDNSDEENVDDNKDDADYNYLAPEDIPPPDPHRHGICPDRPDDRDHMFQYDSSHILSHGVDLRYLGPPVYDQGKMGCCCPHAVAGAFEFSAMQQNLPYFSPSRLFIWYRGRQKSPVHDAVKKNIGISLRDAIQSLVPGPKGGVCSEDDWSYEVGEYNEKKYFINNAKAAQKPPTLAIAHSHQHTAVTYKRFNAGDKLLAKKLMQCLDKGIPFVFGMHHCDILKTDVVKDTGRGIKKPTAKQMRDQTHEHALMAVGYIKEEKIFIIRNSWGADWGDNGHFYMPFSFLYLCYDFWSIKAHKGTQH